MSNVDWDCYIAALIYCHCSFYGRIIQYEFLFLLLSQSFADLWVDFLLKETEEREKRESAGATNASDGNQHNRSPSDTLAASPVLGPRTDAASGFSRSSPSLNHNSPILSGRNILQSEQSESEFSTVPLNSSERTSQVSRLLPRY